MLKLDLSVQNMSLRTQVSIQNVSVHDPVSCTYVVMLDNSGNGFADLYETWTVDSMLDRLNTEGEQQTPNSAKVIRLQFKDI